MPPFLRHRRLIVAALLVAAPLGALACSAFGPDPSTCAGCDASVEAGGDAAKVDGGAAGDATLDAAVEDGSTPIPDAGALCVPKPGEPTLLCLTFDEPDASIPSLGLVAIALNADAAAVSVDTVASSSPPKALHITMPPAPAGVRITGVSATTSPTIPTTKTIRLRFDLRFTGSVGFTPMALYFKKDLGPPAYIEILSDSSGSQPSRLRAFGVNDAGVQVQRVDVGVSGLTAAAWHQIEMSIGFNANQAPTVTVTIDGQPNPPLLSTTRSGQVRPSS